jgi:hypothetical protein
MTPRQSTPSKPHRYWRTKIMKPLEIKDPKTLIAGAYVSRLPEEFVRNFVTSSHEVQFWESTRDIPPTANATELYEWLKESLSLHARTAELPVDML